MLQPGTVVDDKYEILAPLGAGGYGCIFSARHVLLDRLVALKLLRTTLLDEPDGLSRFEREAKAIDSIKHRNVVSLYGFGVFEQSPYMVMEFVKGESLEKAIAAAGKLDPTTTSQIMYQVFDGLSAAHAVGVVHRDLKPSNIMLIQPEASEDKDASTRRVKLIDFGLAKLMPGYGIPAQKLTEAGFAIGTCQYMSPEQCTGNPIDARADLYSAGCIMYECLTGELPFEAYDEVTMMMKHTHEIPPKIATSIGDSATAVALQSILDNLLAKDPRDRYESAIEARDDLQRVLKNEIADVKAASPITRANQTLKTMSRRPMAKNIAIALIAIATTIPIVAWLLKGAPVGESIERKTSGDVATQITRDWVRTVPSARPRVPAMESALQLDQKDHQLTDRLRMRFLIWIIYVNVNDKKYPEAMAYADRALKQRALMLPSDLDARDEVLLAQSLWRLPDQKYKAASDKILSELSTRGNLYPKNGGEILKGKILPALHRMETGDLNGAKRILDAALVELRDSITGQVAIYTMRGDLHMLQGKYHEASADYDRSLEYPYPYPLNGLLGQLRVAIQLNKIAEAAKLEPLVKREFERTNFRTDSNSTYMLRISLAARQSEHDKAQQIAREWTKHYTPQDLNFDLQEFDWQQMNASLKKAGYQDVIEIVASIDRK